MVLRLHLEMPLHSGLGLSAWWIVTGRKRREGKPEGVLISFGVKIFLFISSGRKRGDHEDRR